MKLKAIIIDDEADSRKLLKQKLAKWQPETEVLDLCENAKDGLLSIVTYKPDLIFLDINMPGLNGLEFFRYVSELRLPLQCIITTGYTETAYYKEAVRLGLTDYLLKPVIKEELQSAVANAIARIAAGRHYTLIPELVRSLKEKKYTLPIANGAIVLSADQVLYASSAGKYTDLFLRDGSKELVMLGISELEQQLSQTNLVRIDRFMLLNPSCVVKVLLQFNKVKLNLENGTIDVVVSKVGAEKIFEVIKG